MFLAQVTPRPFYKAGLYAGWRLSPESGKGLGCSVSASESVRCKKPGLRFSNLRKARANAS